jgi:hypothetical protein
VEVVLSGRLCMFDLGRHRIRLRLRAWIDLVYLQQAVAAHGEVSGQLISRGEHTEVPNWKYGAVAGEMFLCKARRQVTLMFARVREGEARTLIDLSLALAEKGLCLAGPQLIPVFLKANPRVIKGMDHILFAGGSFGVMRSKKTDPTWYLQYECLALRAVGTRYGVESVAVARTDGRSVSHPQLYWLAVCRI